MIRSILAAAALLAGPLATPAFAATVTIAVKAPEGLAIKISSSTTGRKDQSSKTGKFQAGHYLATFNSEAPFFCATVTTPGWEVVFPEGATTKRVCFPFERMKKATVGGQGVRVFTANYQKL